MNLSIYSVEDLILTALKSEIEAQEAYSSLAAAVKNFVLKDRLNFLAGEENKHEQFFHRLFLKYFPNKELVVPSDKSPVPLPEIIVDTESMPLSEILESAMNAETMAGNFYLGMVDRFEGQPEVQKMLRFIASMEMGHYKVLEMERNNAKAFEDYDSEWPLMHVGP